VKSRFDSRAEGPGTTPRRVGALGHTRSFWDFYRGIGAGCYDIPYGRSGSLLATGLAGEDERAPRLGPILTTFLFAYGVLAVNSYAYFFLGPVIAEILIAACLGLAIVTAKSQVAAYAGTARRA
jgi:hypothetical protein